MIKAECHSDDRKVEVNFDATQWFKQATEQNIIDLAKCEWRNDYPADEVAIYMADFNTKIKTMFDYIAIVGEFGFECSVDEDDAKIWIKANLPVLWIKLLKDTE